jgi:hypothetical protein
MISTFQGKWENSRWERLILEAHCFSYHYTGSMVHQADMFMHTQYYASIILSYIWFFIDYSMGEGVDKT